MKKSRCCIPWGLVWVVYQRDFIQKWEKQGADFRKDELVSFSVRDLMEKLENDGDAFSEDELE